MPLLRRLGSRQMGVLTASSPYVNNSKQQCQATCTAHGQQQQDNCLRYNPGHTPILHSIPVSTVVLMFTNICSSNPHYTLAAPINITGMSHENLKSPATRLFARYIVKVNLKENVKHVYDCVFVTGNGMALSWLCIGGIITTASCERHGVSNLRRPGCLFNNLFRVTTKAISMFRITDPLWGEFTRGRWFNLASSQWYGKCFNVMEVS